MNTRPWSRYEILVLPTGIDNVEMEEDSRSIAGYYDLNGRQVSGKQRGPVFEIECINLCSEKNFVCRQYKRKNAQYEEIAVYAEKGKDLVQLSEITRHARHNAQVSKSLCSVRVTSKRLAGRGFSSFASPRRHLLLTLPHNPQRKATGARVVQTCTPVAVLCGITAGEAWGCLPRSGGKANPGVGGKANPGVGKGLTERQGRSSSSNSGCLRQRGGCRQCRRRNWCADGCRRTTRRSSREIRRAPQRGGLRGRTS